MAKADEYVARRQFKESIIEYRRAIQVQNWPPLNTRDIFERTAETFKSDAWIVGRTTMQEFSSKKAHKLPKPDASIRKQDFVSAEDVAAAPAPA